GNAQAFDQHEPTVVINQILIKSFRKFCNKIRHLFPPFYYKEKGQRKRTALFSIVNSTVSKLLSTFCSYDDDLRSVEVRIREVQSLLLFFGYRHTSSNEVNLAGRQCHWQRIKFHIFNLQLHAQVLSDLLCQNYVIAN